MINTLNIFYPTKYVKIIGDDNIYLATDVLPYSPFNRIHSHLTELEMIYIFPVKVEQNGIIYDLMWRKDKHFSLLYYKLKSADENKWQINLPYKKASLHELKLLVLQHLVKRKYKFIA